MPLNLYLVAARAWSKRVFALCKKYWQILVGAAIPILIFIVFRQKDSLKKVLDEANKNHEKEIDAINKSHEKEIHDREIARKRYDATIREIESRYSQESETLDKKKRKEIDKLLADTTKSSEEVTKRLSEITGFDIHVSE